MCPHTDASFAAKPRLIAVGTGLTRRVFEVSLSISQSIHSENHLTLSPGTKSWSTSISSFEKDVRKWRVYRRDTLHTIIELFRLRSLHSDHEKVSVFLQTKNRAIESAVARSNGRHKNMATVSGVTETSTYGDQNAKAFTDDLHPS